MQIGILALQGAVDPHVKKLRALKVEPLLVRRPEQLEVVAGLILPGGESTTFLKLIERNNLWQPLTKYLTQRPCFGVCAGAILLAEQVINPTQPSFCQIAMTIERNAYGRQLDSAIVPLTPTENWPEDATQEGIFIRAPIVQKILDQKNVNVLFHRGTSPVMVEQGLHLAATFHPELSAGNAIHRYFLNKTRSLL